MKMSAFLLIWFSSNSKLNLVNQSTLRRVATTPQLWFTEKGS